MKKIICGFILIFAVEFLGAQVSQAQGTVTYLSDLGQSSSGSLAIGSDSWLAWSFETGSSTSGYSLNSIQLEMAGASGVPSGFTVMIYSAVPDGQLYPGNSLGTLNGPSSPTTDGVYSYSPASAFILSSETAYFLVLTAGTKVANGAYNLSYTGTYSYGPSGGWAAPLGLSAIDNYQSADGSGWSFLGGPAQFAINATPTPEPGAIGLLGMGGLIFGLCRWKKRV